MFVQRHSSPLTHSFETRDENRAEYERLHDDIERDPEIFQAQIPLINVAVFLSIRRITHFGMDSSVCIFILLPV